MELAIEATDLVKRYGATVALDGLTLSVRRGEVLGLLGPNGAGKSTFVECAVGLRTPDAGTIRTLGMQPGRELCTRVGVQLQHATLPDRLRVGEALELFAALYPRTADPRALLARWGLERVREQPFGKLSGGERQRLFLALALLHEPELVVLDELTTGLDPEARRSAWALVRALRSEGLTVVLVTHDVAEAEALCDRVAIINRGQVLACAPTDEFGGLETAYFSFVGEGEAWPVLSAR
ncbi:ABC transporter ATP-binding protein [Solirubrobacter sp. CPCC 204708]|uniref:ABC transporter ATP-binding protein n=1 Tax=Solirubrobacter deserti TaxID=2282478 RepID=A0ABT4RLE8_9ACTN|nr:ABC transporter ATP-binding protein [Solirubrobacter deserti]MBE2318938.1 ABC transporter ATP-binding protein [Solirubrobacter deserti]MDA0139337.1 ABC transporter ATP-binding protein [Solirubrobacter deserti]